MKTSIGVVPTLDGLRRSYHLCPLNGATTMMFEGVPTFPDAGRFWDIIDKYKMSVIFTLLRQRLGPSGSRH